jgi:DNA modification methylase
MNTFYTGDAIEILKTLPAESVHCCVTSPPYFGLRDYGIDGQLGLEQSPEEYVNKLVSVFKEVKKVLRNDGTLWLNLGDSYAGSGKGIGSDHGKAVFTDNNITKTDWKLTDLKSKDLVGIPWMVAFALQADGWYLRSDIIWHKPNAMPESVRDRPTKAHEYMFLLSKNQKYYYDADAIKEPSVSPINNRKPNKRGTEAYANASGIGNNAQLFTRKNDGFRNKRTVWTIPTKPFKGAHFAVFPPDLIRPCILAGTSLKNCPKCGGPWFRVIKKTGHINRREPAHAPNNCPTKTDPTGWKPTTIGTEEFMPSCSCQGNDGSQRSIILDLFGGSGTVAMVAEELDRDSIYIDLNPEYTEMAKGRVVT